MGYFSGNFQIYVRFYFLFFLRGGSGIMNNNARQTRIIMKNNVRECLVIILNIVIIIIDNIYFNAEKY